MDIDVRPSRVIDAPPERVREVMFDPLREREWTANVLASEVIGEGPFGPGSRVRREVRFLGRTFPYVYEVVDTDGASFLELQVQQPFPMRVTYQVEGEGAGTRASIHARGTPGGFFRLVGPWLARSVERAIAKDLSALAAVVENAAG